jgi:hypothetical protein
MAAPIYGTTLHVAEAARAMKHVHEGDHHVMDMITLPVPRSTASRIFAAI